jgi:DNA-binding PadR family transcriptional regulator
MLATKPDNVTFERASSVCTGLSTPAYRTQLVILIHNGRITGELFFCESPLAEDVQIRIDKVVEFRHTRISTMESKDKPPSPLSPAALQILAALAADDLHGNGVIQAVCLQSQGRVRIGPGTLYDNLKRFIDQGWICDQPASDNEKRLYHLTSAGNAALSHEISRLEHLVRQTKPYLQGLKPTRAE